MSCPFCEPVSERVFYSDTDILCLWDGFPVSEGHVLVVTRRHVVGWFEATVDEQLCLVRGIELARQEIERLHQPAGFNIGINIGEAGGQTVPHLHVHVIPRYTGDVYDPRGGVRHVIPAKAKYWPQSESRQASVADGELDTARPSVFGNEERSLVESLGDDMSQASHIDLAVAFVTESGLDVVESFFLDLFRRQGSMRFLTGDYLGFNEPRVFLRLLDWTQEHPQKAEVRIFQTDQYLGFHPKAYLIHKDYAGATAYIGSSNLTKQALTTGLEWNQRIEGSFHDTPLSQIRTEFERLFSHPKTTSLSQQWIDNYTNRRGTRTSFTQSPGIDTKTEQRAEVPKANSIQKEALAALSQTREDGNKAGLVVMATGIGKTWLAAFDSVNFKHVLFVAHREEILNQALRTFRRIRPEAKFGLYMGGQYDRGAEVLFASIQTLGRQNHLNQFDPDHFDYIIVDEFHHAAARTYRRLIDYFNPVFLIGLTATPERTDGGDLLGLCGENLVYRRDLVDGINQNLLCPFHYFGVPDEVDFTNIPWRSGRFDPEQLEHAVATEKRAQNAFEQWKKHGQTRTLAFCVSKRHADFMTEFFTARGVRSVAVHSGPGSAPRTQSLEQLGNGALQIVFSVDMFNEGVDVPNIDTVMMLRPTESKILWLQQLGRGLRIAENKKYLAVIDYIGNHRTFLQVPMVLLPGAGTRPGEVSQTLLALENGELDLPKGCLVEYELEALNILKRLARPGPIPQQITRWYRNFRELHGRRPSSSEAWHEGYDPRKLRTGFGSWLGFINSEGDLSEAEIAAFEAHKTFFEALEITPMTRSFKMITLLAMITAENFPGEIGIEDLGLQVARIAGRIQLLRNEFGSALDNTDAMKRLLEPNPIAAWTAGRGMGDRRYFTYENNLFASVSIADMHAKPIREMTREICDYRLAQYLDRLQSETGFASNIVCEVSHSTLSPILILPSRDENPGIPMGWTNVIVGGETYQVEFAKMAMSVMRRRDSEVNRLSEVLRSFFGEDAGASGTSQQVKFQLVNGKYYLYPMIQSAEGPELWKEYMRADIPSLWGLEFSVARWNKGFVAEGEHIFLLVTLDNRGMVEEYQYEDRFHSPDLLQWHSQNQTRRETPTGQKIAKHKQNDVSVHLFARDRKKLPNGKAAPFVYCGDVLFNDWKSDNPITVFWRLLNPLSEQLFRRFEVD